MSNTSHVTRTDCAEALLERQRDAPTPCVVAIHDAFDEADLGRTWDMTNGSLTIGRAPTNGVCIDHPSISQRHAEILRVEGDFFLFVDLGSKNGSFVNGKTVRDQRLASGDRITFCQTVLKFVIADPIERAYLDTMRRLATSDDLTGLANRRHLHALLARELRAAQRRTRPLSLLLLDVDDMGGANRRLGRAGGDDLLRRLADTVRASLRASDLAGRTGGDEIAIVLPATRIEEAHAVAEGIGQRIAAEIGVTASFGLAALAPDSDADHAALAHRAGERLARAKQTGRHAIVAG